MIVLYHPKTNKLSLYNTSSSKYSYWMGEPFCVWKSLEVAMGYGWEVIGEL